MKKIGSCLFLFILCFGLISCAHACDLGIDSADDDENFGSVISARNLNLGLDDDSDDDDEEDGDDFDDDNDNDEEDEEYEDYEDYEPICHHWEWKEIYYCIPLEFNLTDEELTELFTKRDVLREEIANHRSLIEKMELSRSDDILLIIDDLFEAINKITNNTEFNDLLLSLKDINITELTSSFNDLKKLLESIKEEYPDEDFTEIDSLMTQFEILLDMELDEYESLVSKLKDKIVELYELYEKYPFLGQDIFRSVCTDNIKNVLLATAYDDDYDSVILAESSENSEDSKNLNRGSVEMKSTGMPYFHLVLLFLFSLIGLNLKRKF